MCSKHEGIQMKSVKSNEIFRNFKSSNPVKLPPCQTRKGARLNKIVAYLPFRAICHLMKI